MAFSTLLVYRKAPMMENKIELVFLQTFEVASNTALHFADSQPLTKSSGLRLLQTHF